MSEYYRLADLRRFLNRLRLRSNVSEASRSAYGVTSNNDTVKGLLSVWYIYLIRVRRLLACIADTALNWWTYWWSIVYYPPRTSAFILQGWVSIDKNVRGARLLLWTCCRFIYFLPTNAMSHFFTLILPGKTTYTDNLATYDPPLICAVRSKSYTVRS